PMCSRTIIKSLGQLRLVQSEGCVRRSSRWGPDCFALSSFGLVPPGSGLDPGIGAPGPVQRGGSSKHHPAFQGQNLFAFVFPQYFSPEALLEIVDSEHTGIGALVPAAEIKASQSLVFVTENFAPGQKSVGPSNQIPHATVRIRSIQRRQLHSRGPAAIPII